MQRVGLAQAIVNDPEILFLDEPTSGLDPAGRKLVRDVIREQRDRGATVFLNSHLLGEVEKSCDRVAFIREGAPGKGFFSKWKSTKYENNSPTTAKIDANGDNGIIWNIPEIKASVNLKFDGKDVAPTGPTVPNGLTLAATKVGHRSFDLVEKMNGKVIFKARMTVSADGKTMTEVGTAVGSTVPERLVYNKAA